MITCPNCNGVGRKDGPTWVAPIAWETKTCPTCQGKRKVENKYSKWVTCPICKGWGKEPPLITNLRCQCCNGIGMTTPSRASRCK